VVKDYTARHEVNNLSLNKAIDMAQNRSPCRDCCLHLALHTPRVHARKKDKFLLLITNYVSLTHNNWPPKWCYKTLHSTATKTELYCDNMECQYLDLRSDRRRAGDMADGLCAQSQEAETAMTGAQY